jgi:hypothetical protein
MQCYSITHFGVNVSLRNESFTMKISSVKWHDVTEEWNCLLNKELRNLCSSSRVAGSI